MLSGLKSDEEITWKHGSGIGVGCNLPEAALGVSNVIISNSIKFDLNDLIGKRRTCDL